MTKYPQLVDNTTFWSIPMNGKFLDQFLVDAAIHLLILNRDERGTQEYMITFETAFTLMSKGESVQIVSEYKESLTPVFALLFKMVMDCKVYKTGRLEVTFEDSEQLIALPDEQFEAWNISGLGGLLIVCNIVEGISVWHPS